jgi:hypothetical protein
VRVALVLTVLLVATAAAAQKPVDPATEFAAARRAYEQKRYPDVIARLRPLIYPNILVTSEEQVVDAHKLLAISLLMSGDREAAKKEFVSLLGYRPDYVLDPGADPPAAAPFLEAVRRELDQRTRAARDQRVRDEERRRLEELLARRPVVYVDRPTVVERIVDRRSRFPLYIPFGYGQFDNGQRGKGWFFLGAESALLGATIATFAVYQAGQGDWRRSDQNTIRALQWSNAVCGGAFVAVALWGIIDAVRNAPPRESVSTRPPQPASRPSRASLRLTPGGLALEGAF